MPAQKGTSTKTERCSRLNTSRLAAAILFGLTTIFGLSGCGTTKSVTATEQLLMSDAVDSTITKLDFRPLSGYKVFLDTTYVAPAGKVVPGVPMAPNLVNSDYVISGIRQQLTAAGCMLVDSKDNAEIICEARCGALGTDANSMTYGIPATNLLSSASTVISSAPPIPTIPEISIAKRESKSAAAKVAIFAYDKETREPLWQSGIAQSGSSARDTWFLGMGPVQYGSIYSGTRIAGKRLKRNQTHSDESRLAKDTNGVSYRNQHLFAANLFSPKRKDKENLAENEKAGSKDAKEMKPLTADNSSANGTSTTKR